MFCQKCQQGNAQEQFVAIGHTFGIGREPLHRQAAPLPPPPDGRRKNYEENWSREPLEQWVCLSDTYGYHLDTSICPSRDLVLQKFEGSNF